MKATKLLLTFALLIAGALPAAAAITRVQSATANTAATNGASLNLTFGATPTAGNTIILAVGGHLSSLALVRATEQTGITWMSYQMIGSPNLVLIVGRVSSGIASATVTVTSNLSATIAVVGVEYSGTNLRVDKQKTNTAGTGTSASTGTTDTTSNANELWVAGITAKGQLANTMSAPTNSFAIVAQTNTTNNGANLDVSTGLLERIVSSTGAANTAVTITNNAWQGMILTLEETPTAAAAGSSVIPSIGN